MATALIAGNVSCSQPAGGNVIDGGVNGGGEEETDWKQPAYMNVTAEFEGQRFVEAGTDWQTDNQGYTKYTARYNDADKYINCKVTELNNLWQKNNTGSALSNQIGNALSNFNNGASISGKINNNYAALAPVFATMESDLLKNEDTVNYYRYKTSYQKLAANAYNNSLGHWSNSEDNRVLTNKEMKNLPENYFVKELGWAGLDYNKLTVKEARNNMNDFLTQVSASTNTSPTVLKKVVELALYNESLYGLNDLAKLDNLVFRETLRVMDIFETAISTARNNTRTQSIDDRTM